jgi:hypothetical protein
VEPVLIPEPYLLLLIRSLANFFGIYLCCTTSSPETSQACNRYNASEITN